MSRFTLALPAVVVVAVFAIAIYSGRDTDADRIDAYCAYGARSQAQWDGCATHVAIKDVEAANSRASRCALDGECDGHRHFWDRWLELKDFCSDGDHADPKVCRGRAARYLR